MAKSIHVKAKTPWKRIEIPKNGFEAISFDGLIDVQELTDYDFIRTDKSTKSAKKRKSTNEAECTAAKIQKSENKSDDKNALAKKKGKKMKKKKVSQTIDNTSNDTCDVAIGESSDLKCDEDSSIQMKNSVNDKEGESENKISKRKKGRSRKKKTQMSTCDEDSSVQMKNPATDNKEGESENKISKRKKGRSRKKKTQMSTCDEDSSVQMKNPVTENEEGESQNKISKRKKGKSRKKKIETSTSESTDTHSTNVNGANNLEAVCEIDCDRIVKKTTSQKANPSAQEKATNPHLDMSKWNDLFIPDVLLKSLQDQGFQNPTTIQTLTLPSAVRDHKDILAAAETGSGKTLAFGIPVVAKILSHQKREENKQQSNECSDDLDEEADDDESNDNGNDVVMDEDDENDSRGDEKKVANKSSSPPLALILEPTRELAVQVHRHLTRLSKYTNIKFAIVVGGMSVEKQRRLLKHCPEVIIATPGRLWQLIEEGDEHLRKVDLIHSLVVDEADRMVEKGHYEELTRLLHMINKSPRRDKKRQSFVMSATLTMELVIPKRLLNKMKEKDVEKDKLKSLTSKICVGTKPKVIDLTPKDKVAQSLTEMRVNCTAKEKDNYLYYFLNQHPGRTLVFANSKDCLRRLVSVFTLLECSPYPLHADMQQRQRLKNLDRFSANSKGLLLASDVAARGLDIPNVDYVIHYQVPQTMENYVHRSGRTARASNVGLSVMLVAPEDARNYRKIVHGVKNGEELPIMPIDLDLLPAVKNRVELARAIDVAEHRAKKIKLHNDFFSKAAEEMDMILDDETLVPRAEDSASEAEEKYMLKQKRQQLSAMVKESLAPIRMTKYPTKSGKLMSMKSINLFQQTK